MPLCPGAHCSSITAEINALCKSDGFTGNVVYVQHNGQYCYCNCSCVAVDTLIAVGNNIWRRMGELEVGDKVLTLDNNKSWVEADIKFSNGTGEGDGNPVPYAIFVSFENGVDLIVTADHPFLLGNGKLQVASRLSPSDEVMDEHLKPIGIKTIGFGEYFGGIHNISTSVGTEGEPLEGHLINTGGLISGDFYAQLYLVEEEQLKAPLIGMPEYFSKHEVSKSEKRSLVGGNLPSNPNFFLHEDFSAQSDAASFLPDWMEQTDPANLRPLDDTIPLEMANYLIHNFRKSYPDIVYHVNWADNTVNAYAWREGSTRHVAILGGLIRHRAVGIEGLGMVIAHEIGHHYGGAPRYPNNPWASCEGQSDYWGSMVAMREVWWGEEALRQIEEAAQQLYNLFAFGLISSFSEKEAEKRIVALAGCGHPPADCRRDTYLSALTLAPKPACAD